MIVNGSALLRAAPLSPMLATKERAHGTSFGLAEAGADIRVKQTIRFVPPDPLEYWDAMRSIERSDGDHRLAVAFARNALMAFHGYVEVDGQITVGRCALASSIERFDVPNHLVAIIGHKSTNARRFACAWAGTTAEPGWSGHLTIELTFHGLEPVTIPAGSGIAQVLFHELAEPADYGNGKYQGQANRPVPAIMEG